VYVGSSVYNGGQWLSVIDTRTNVATDLRLLFSPSDFAVSPDGGTLYFLVDAGDQSPNFVAFFDPNTGAVVDTITLPTDSRPQSLAVHPSGRVLYVLNSVNYTPSVIELDLNAKTIARTLPVPGDGRLDFVSSCDGDCGADGEVSVDELIGAVTVALG